MSMNDPGALPEKIGRYEIVRELGRGAMGIIFEGMDPTLGRRVAIKTARRDVMEATGMTGEMMERFLREARAAGNLNHPNIITIYDAGEEAGMAYMAMEYLEGGDLSDVIRRKVRLSIEEIVEIGAVICDALYVAHQAGIVHRDIKPANILTPPKPDGGFSVKVADFGIAHMADSQLTQEGQLIGTPNYMSPEQFMGQHIDGRSDLFSVGAILYELLTGEKPFGGEALNTVMHQVINSDPIAPKDLNLFVSEALNTVIFKAMAKRPTERYADAQCMAAALRETLKAKPDPRVLQGGGSALDATEVVEGVETDQTIPVAETPSESREDGDATVPAAQLPTDPDWAQQAATSDAPTPRQSEEDSLVIPEPEHAPAGEPAAAKKKLGLAAVAVLCVALLGGLVYLMGGGNGELPVDAPGAQVDETAPVPPGPEEPYYQRFRANIFVTTTQDTYDKYYEGVLDEGDIQAHLVPPERVGLQIALRFHDADGEVFQEVEDYQSGAMLTLEEPHQTMEVTVRHSGMETYLPLFSGAATRPEQDYSAGMFILPPASE